MLIIGCDYHPSMQQIAWVDTETGEGGERRLLHSRPGTQGFHSSFYTHLDMGHHPPTRKLTEFFGRLQNIAATTSQTRYHVDGTSTLWAG